MTLTGDLTLTTHFTLSGTPTENIVINEINYNSPDAPNSGDWLELYNPNNQTVDLSNWTLEDEDAGLFTIPSGTILPPDSYLVLVEDETDLHLSILPSATIWAALGVGQLVSNSATIMNC